MNISPINNNQSNTNFRALKSIEFGKKFKDNPKLQSQLLDAFEKSKALQEICKKYDVGISFDTCSAMIKNVLATMQIRYAHRPTEEKTFIEKLVKGPEPPCFYYNIDADDFVTSLEETTSSLCANIAKPNKKFDKMLKFYEERPELVAAQDAFELAQKEKIMANEELKKEQALIDKRIESILKNQ